MNKLQFCVSILGVMALSACATQKQRSAPPPTFDLAKETGHEMYAEKFDPSYLQDIEPAAGISIPSGYSEYAAAKGLGTYEPYTSSSLNDGQIGSGCNFANDFDQQALLAYQWGQNRLGLNVDRTRFGVSDSKEMKMTYSIKLQDISNSDNNTCRNVTSWHGVLGNGLGKLSLK